MAIITISHSAFGGGREVAERVASVLDHRCISREVLLEASKLYGIPEAKFSETLESDPNWWKRWRESVRVYRAALQAAMFELAQEGKIVYHGRAGQAFFRDVEHVLKILLLAPMEYRMQQVKARMGLGDRDALDYIEHTDRIRSRRFKAIFEGDRLDPTRYDLVVNFSSMDLNTVAELIIDASQKHDFQLDIESTRALRDSAVTARVQAALAMAPQTLNLEVGVKTTDGVVSLYGVFADRGLANEIARIAGDVSGVAKVVPDFVFTDRAQAVERAID